MRSRLDLALAVSTLVCAVTFLVAGAQNFGARVAAGPIDVYFSAPIWQAGVGEVVIGIALLLTVWRGTTRIYWTAYVLSVLGIAFGLSSVRVVGAAREIHVLLVPLAVLGIALLAGQTVGDRRRLGTQQC